MKNYFTIAAAAVLIFCTSCSSDEPSASIPESIDNSEVAKSVSTTRTLDEAVEIAQNAIGMLPKGDSRSGIRTFDKNKVKYAISKSQSRSAGSDTLMYVFNFEDNQGFAIVAASKAVPGLIAVTELGSYDPDITPDNPGLADYMDIAKIYLSQQSNSLRLDTANRKPIDLINPNPDLAQYRIIEDTVYKNEVFPNFNLRWGQDFPEGMLVPNGVAGCTNTAALIAMSYLEYPTSLNLTFCSPTTIEIDWKEIKKHKQSFNNVYSLNSDGCSEYTHTTMAQICRELAERNNSDWVSSEYATSTYFGNLVSTLKSMGLHPSNVKDFPDGANALATLNTGGILLVSAERVENGRHTFVVDGGIAFSVHKGEYMKEAGKPWVMIQDHGTTNYQYDHINWGWNGKGNGYFTCTIYNANKPYKYDDPNKPALGYYSEAIRYISLYK